MDATLYITIPLFLIFIATVVFFEMKRKSSSFFISVPDAAHISLLFSSAFMIAMTYGTIKRNISFKNHYGFQDDSISNIISIIISFLFIVTFSILLIRFFIRYRKAESYAEEILCNSHKIYKAGTKYYKRTIISLIDEMFGYGIFSGIKRPDDTIKNALSMIMYIKNRFYDSDIQIKEEYMYELILLATQSLYLPGAYIKTMTHEEFELFEYTEKKVIELGKIKPIFPNKIFSIHKKLIESDENNAFLRIESYFIEQTISYFYKFKNMTKDQFLKKSEEELKDIEKSDRDKHLVSEYFNLLSSNNNVSQYHTNNNFDKEIDTNFEHENTTYEEYTEEQIGNKYKPKLRIIESEDNTAIDRLAISYELKRKLSREYILKNSEKLKNIDKTLQLLLNRLNYFEFDRDTIAIEIAEEVILMYCSAFDSNEFADLIYKTIQKAYDSSNSDWYENMMDKLLPIASKVIIEAIDGNVSNSKIFPFVFELPYNIFEKYIILFPDKIIESAKSADTVKHLCDKYLKLMNSTFFDEEMEAILNDMR